MTHLRCSCSGTSLNIAILLVNSGLPETQRELPSPDELTMCRWPPGLVGLGASLREVGY